MARSQEGTTSPPQAGMARRMLRYPLVWMVGGLILVNALPLILVTVVLGDVPGMNRATRPLLGVAVSVALYWMVMHFWAGRRITEFPRAQAGRDLSRGVLLGFGYMAATLAILAATGAYSMRWAGLSWAAIWPALLVNVWPGIVEELTLRGLVLQALERLGGSWVGLLGSAALFGALHLSNPGATVWTAIAISLEAGLLLGGAFLLVRNLWLPIGIHYAWDATQDLGGVPQDGGQTTPEGLFATTAHGPEWLTGMPFAIEGSVVAVVLGVLIAAGLLTMAVRRGTLRPPGRGQQVTHRHPSG